MFLHLAGGDLVLYLVIQLGRACLVKKLKQNNVATLCTFLSIVLELNIPVILKYDKCLYARTNKGA